MIVDKKLINVRNLVVLMLCTILYYKCTNNFETTYSNKIWFGGYIIPDPLDKNSIALGVNYIEVINDTTLLLYFKNKIVDSIRNTELKKEFEIQHDVLTI
ncbi:MAG TPA: hypothetical protein PKD85_06200, partial [Saprospiraceae bacterium]|nr:hypothetical protein [Saprospiraceae bacterium]